MIAKLMIYVTMQILNQSFLPYSIKQWQKGKLWQISEHGGENFGELTNKAGFSEFGGKNLERPPRLQWTPVSTC